MSFQHGDVRVLEDVLAGWRVRRADRMLGRAVGVGRRRRQPGLRGAVESGRRLQLPGARPPPTAPTWSSSRPAACTRSPRSSRWPSRRPTPASSSPTRRRFRAPPGRASPRTSRSTGARTIYGATKLSAELLIEEYRAAYGLRAVINRCGVIAGPWQMGKVDQGVFTYWMLAHHLRSPARVHRLRRPGQAGRDLLHVEDLVDLLAIQLEEPDALGWRHGQRRRRSRVQPVAARDDRTVPRDHRQPARGRPQHETRPGDVPIYLSDCAQAGGPHELAPRNGPRTRDPRATSAIGSRSTRPRSDARLSVAVSAARRRFGYPRGCMPTAHRHRLRRPDRLGVGPALREAGYDVVGLENDMRARFFGPTASTARTTERLAQHARRLVPLARDRHPRPRRGASGSSPSTPARSSWSSTRPRSPRTTGRPPIRRPTSRSTPTAR